MTAQVPTDIYFFSELIMITSDLRFQTHHNHPDKQKQKQTEQSNFQLIKAIRQPNNNTHTHSLVNQISQNH